MTDIEERQSKTTEDRDGAPSPSHELFILALTLLSLFNLVIIVVRPISSPAAEIAFTIEAVTSIFFLFDFLHRLSKAESKGGYLLRDWGWADLGASLPLPGLRLLKVPRLVRTMRAIRALGRDEVRSRLAENRAGSTLFVAIFLTILLLESAGSAILTAESSNAASRITSAQDALWWGYVTITTVGYGDLYPTTTAGRIIGVLLMTSGVALFSVFTGFLANAFLSPRRKRWIRPDEPATDAHAQLAAMRSLLDAHEESTDALRERIAELERSLPGSG